MLQSTRIEKRQSEVRERLAALAGTEKLTDEQRSEMEALDVEYGDNEKRKRAALIAEDEQREQAGKELETRDGKEWDKLVAKYELRQAALYLDEGREPTGETAEVVQEMRSQGGYRGVPVPLAALEMRANETTSGDVPAPRTTGPIIPELFPQSVAASMGARIVNIASGENEYPILTDGVSAAWAGSETGNVGGPTQVKTSPFTLKPDSTLGAQAVITRKSLKQSGTGLEQAIRRDMGAAIQAALDKAIFQGSGSSGEPSGIVSKATGYSITVSDKSGNSLDYATMLAEAASMMGDNVAQGPGSIRVLARPEVWTYLEGKKFDTGSGITAYDKIASKFGGITLSSDALTAPSSNVSNLLLTTSAGGLSPIFVGLWGGVDMIRDQFTKAHSGQLIVTGLLTADVTASRASQLRVVKVKSA